MSFCCSAAALRCSTAVQSSVRFPPCPLSCHLQVVHCCATSARRSVVVFSRSTLALFHYWLAEVPTARSVSLCPVVAGTLPTVRPRRRSQLAPLLPPHPPTSHRTIKGGWHLSATITLRMIVVILHRRHYLQPEFLCLCSDSAHLQASAVSRGNNGNVRKLLDGLVLPLLLSLWYLAPTSSC